MNLHHLAEERSLEYHRLVAQQLEQDPALLDAARRRVAAWLTGSVAAGAPHPHYAQGWSALLASPLPIIQARLVDPGPEGTALRQVTPFAGAISPRVRWKLWREVRQRHAGV
jgi:hypothetical protein